MPSMFSKALALLVFSCVSQFVFSETTYPLTVLDGLGHEMVIAKKPQSVSSLTLFTDELFLEILDHNKISSMTYLAKDDTFSNIVNQLPKGMTFLDMNVESIINIYPDIVFAANWSDASKVAQLRNAGILVYLIDTPTTIKTIQNEMLKLAGILDVLEEATTLVEAMDLKLDSLQERSKILANKNLVALDYNTWGSASGADTTWNEVLTLTGIANGAAKYEAGQYGQVALSKEMIVDMNPDLLFLPAWVYGDPDGAEVFRNEVLADPALANVNAVKNGQLYLIPEKLRGSFSQYIVETVDFILAAVSEKQ